MISWMRPGRNDSKATRSARNTASLIECVTSRIVFDSLKPDALQLDVHHVAGDRIERAERLVHQEGVRVIAKRARNRGALTHASRKLAGAPFLETLDADEGTEIGGFCAALGFGDATELQRQRDIVLYGQPRKQIGVLEHHAHIGDRARISRVVVPQIATTDAHDAGGRMLKPGN